MSRRCNPGETAYPPSGLEFAVGQNLLLLRSDGNQIYRPFLRWLVHGPEWWGQVGKYINVGAVFDSLRLPDIPRFMLHLPSMPEQQGIASVLDALDDKIEWNRRVGRRLDTLAASEFDLWRGRIPTTTMVFGSFCRVYGGSTPKTDRSDFWGGQHPWVTPTDVTALDTPYLFETRRTITDAGLASASTELHPPGTIFMTSRATIGAFAVTQIPCAPNQGFIAVEPEIDPHRWFLFHEMRRRVPEMLDIANGSTFPEISRGAFKAMPVEVPIEASNLDDFHLRVDPLHARAAAAASESRTLAALRDALLPELLSGRLRVPEAREQVEAVV